MSIHIYNEDKRLKVLNLAAENARLKASNKELVEALKPFAAIAVSDKHVPSGESVFVNINRCREARAAIERAAG